MKKLIKIKGKEYFTQGEWRYIAIEGDNDHLRADDEDIYHYVTKEQFDNVKVGQTILLDEEFKVLEIE